MEKPQHTHEEAIGKGVPIDYIPDPRIESILADPEGHFAEVRAKIREEVIEEMARERRVTALNTATRQEINGRTVFSVPAIIRGFRAKRR